MEAIPIYYIVYEIKNLINNKIYVGAHATKNINDMYMGSGKLIKRAIKKYGSENFTRTLICFCESVEDMYRKEREIVNKEFISRDDTYNLNIGGVGSSDYCIRKKISDSNKGRKKSEKTKQNMSKAQKLRKHKPLSIEHKAKIGLASKGHTLSAESRAKLSASNTGKIVSEEAKQNMSKSHIGVKLSLEHKNKISLSALSFRRSLMTEEQKMLISKEVECITTGQSFINALDASKYFKIRVDHIYGCLRGDANSAGKLQDGTKLEWRYSEDINKKSMKESGYIHPRSRKVQCITTGKIFDSIKEASKEMKAWHICRYLNGKTEYSGKLEDGTKLTWRYV